MRPILGNHDLILESGKVAEFDTRVPHWFGSADGKPADVLSLFGRPAERSRVRTDKSGASG